MPDFRKLHNSHGNSQKLSELSDYEFRVWNQYRASADDFGVCLLSAAKLQGDNRRLAKDSAAKVLKALKQLIAVGLVVPFDHQGQTYLCQINWQDFEDLNYPRRSMLPTPPLEIFRILSEKTQNLFSKKPEVSEEFLRLARAGARETLTFTQRQTLTETQTDPRIEGEGPGEGALRTWSLVLDALLELGLSEHTLSIWFRPCRVIAEYLDAIRVGVPSALYLDWLPRHYREITAQAVEKVAPGKEIRFELLRKVAS